MSYAQIYQKDQILFANSGVYTEHPLPRPTDIVGEPTYW